ncbi:MAG: hydroxyacid dehydrogenase [Granulosicoccus sp.]|nr:hydroxyacid dehydrogenase [Granulosicoccus sp.]
MAVRDRPVIICAPEPRTLQILFTPAQMKRLFDQYEIVECEADSVALLDDATLSRTRYIIGQPPLDENVLGKLKRLRCIFNVESNLMDNMPYEVLFERGIHVVTTGAVFAQPVAELGLALALNLARGIVDADLDFREGRERWGGEGNAGARCLSGSDVGLVGFGDLGKAINRLLSGFRARVRVFDPWLPDSLLREHGVIPSNIEDVLSQSDVVFVVAAVTSENQHFLDAGSFSLMRPGASLILLSRADVVDFDALMDAVRSGRVTAASDVFPEEPLPLDHPVRKLPGFLRSAHRAGALDSAFLQMGDMVLDDMALLDRGLPPMRCKRAERETVGRMRSRPVSHN